MNNFKVLLQAMLDKAKSIMNIKRDIKGIESKLPKIELTGTLNRSKIQREVNKVAKSVKAKIEVDADTTKARRKINDIVRNRSRITIEPTVDNSHLSRGLGETEKQTTSFFGRLSNNLAGLNVTHVIFQQISQAAREAVNNVKELNKTKINIQMASGASSPEVDGMMKSYNGLSKEISSTTKATAESANEFLRMGETVEDTNTLIKNAQMLSKIGMIENADSAKYLISSMKGYKIAAQDSISIVNKLTATDLKAAVSSGDLAEAMSKTANLADSSGISMDNLIGYLATVQETTQKTASVVGTSFQSMLSRMNNIKVKKFVDDETGEDLSDVESVLGKLGIKLRENETTYRKFDDVLKDVASRWEQFNDVERNSVAVAIAGTRQRENMLALFNNFDKALQLSEVSANSAGTALERYGIYQESIEAKTNNLITAFEALSTSTINEGLYRSILEATTGIIEFVDKTQLLKGTLAGLATFGAAKLFTSMATGAIAATKSTIQLTSAMALFNNGRDVSNLDRIGQACIGLSDSQLRLVLSTNGLTNAQRLQILQGMRLNETQIAEKLSTLGFTQATTGATRATFSFTGALNTLKTAFATNPIGMSIMAITTAVTVGTMAFSAYKRSQEELRQSTADAANVYSESSKSIADYTARYQELHDALLAAKGNEEETYNVKKQLLDLQTELNDKFGEEYGYLNLVTDAYRDQTDAIKAYNEEAAQKYLNENKKGIDIATEKMTEEGHYNLSYTGMSGYTESGQALLEIAKKYEDSGVSVLDEMGTGDYSQFSIHLDTDAEGAYETIHAFETDVRDKARELGDEHIFDDVLEISSNEVNRAKETIDDYGELFNQGLVAEITTTNLAPQFDEAVSAVEAYNEAVLKSEDPANDSNVNSAYRNLQRIKSGIQENTDEWGKYASVTDDVFAKADTGMFEFRDSIKANKDGISDLINSFKGKTDTDLLSLEDSGTDDSFNKLIDSADEYGLSVSQVVDELIRMKVITGEVAREADNEINPFSKGEMISAINEMSEGFESLDKIMASIKEDKSPFDFSLLDDKNFKDTFSGLGESYTDFIEQVSTSPKDISACQSAFDELLSAWLNSTDVLKGLSEDTSQLTIDMLSNMGVANAEEVVMSALAEKHAWVAAEKYYNASASAALENATVSETNQILEEAGAAGISAEYLARLELSKIAVNGVQISTSSDIDQIINLANAAGASASSLYKLAAAKEAVGGGALVDPTSSSYDRFAALEGQRTKHKLETGDFDFDYEEVDANKFKSPIYGGGVKTNRPSKGGSKDKEETKKEFDWLSRMFDQLKEKRDHLMSEADSGYISYLGIDPDELERAKELMSLNNSLKNSMVGADPETLSSLTGEANSNLLELSNIAQRAGMSLSELYGFIFSGADAESKSSYLKQVIDLDKHTLEQYGKAIPEYQKQYEEAASKLSDEMRVKVENGSMDIETLTGDDVENVQDAIDAYDTLQDGLNGQAEAYENLRGSTEAYHENNIKAIDAENDKIQQSIDLINAQMEYMAASGQVVNASTYERLISQNQQMMNLLDKKIVEKRAELKALADVGLDEGDEDYLELEAEISECEASIWDLRTAQEEYNDKIRQLPIENMEKVINMYDDISNALQDYADVVEASGKKLDAEYYEMQIQNGKEAISQYKEQADLVRDIMGGYEVGSDKYQEMYDKLNEINSSISSIVQNMHEWNKELLSLPINSMNDQLSGLNGMLDALQDVQSDHETVIQAVTDAINEQIEALEEQRDVESEAVQNEIDALQEKLDLLQKQNEARKIQLALEQAKYDLERAQEQKTNQVVREGKIVYEADQDAIRDASQTKADAEFDKLVHETEAQKEALEESLEAIEERYETQIDQLTEMADKWDEIKSDAEATANAGIADEYLGEGWEDKVTSGNDAGIYDAFKNSYETNNQMISKYEQQIQSTEKIYDLLNSYITAYQAGTISYEQAMASIKSLLSQMNGDMSSNQALQNMLDYLGKVNGTNADADSVLGGIQEQLKADSEEMLKNLEQYNENLDLIADCMTSWEQLTNNIGDIRDLMDEVVDSLDNGFDDLIDALGDYSRDLVNDLDDDDDDEVVVGDHSTGTVSPGGTANSHNTSNNVNSNDDQDNDHGPGIPRYEKGIEKGVIGRPKYPSPTQEEYEQLTKMATQTMDRLRNGQVPIIAHDGEVVFNAEQQRILLDNINSLRARSYMIPTMPVLPVNESHTKNEYNFGNIEVHGVQDADAFAKSLKYNASLLIRQTFSKR